MKLYLVHGSNPKDTTLCWKSSEMNRFGYSKRTKRQKWIPVYRIHTPGMLHISKPTLIYKVLSVSEESNHWYSRSRSGGLIEEEIARVEWHTFRSSSIIYKGQYLRLDDWLPKTGFFRKKRTFQGPDGRWYEWSGSSTSSLNMLRHRKSSSRKKEIARMHQRGFFRMTPRAYLEIDDRFVSEDIYDVLDLIVATWVYIETKRIKERESSDPIEVNAD
ncbi:protein of unknown function DUF6593 [Abortiporus biennis]